jgi:hypothetical protein
MAHCGLLRRGEGEENFAISVSYSFHHPVFLLSTKFINFIHLCVVYLATFPAVLLPEGKGKGKGEAEGEGKGKGKGKGEGEGKGEGKGEGEGKG